MKKFFPVMILSILPLILMNHCSSRPSTDQNSPEVKEKGSQLSKQPGNRQPNGNTPQTMKNRHPEENSAQNKMADLPEHIQKAIKEGKIPKDRVREMMKKRRDTTAPLVAVTPVTRRPINKFLVLNGVVEPEKKVEIFARLSSYVKEIIKEEGDWIKKNDILALLDDSEIKISYQQARIQTQQAKITLLDEERKYNRYKKLKETELISEQDFQTTQLNFQKAKLDYENKKENEKNLELQFSYTRIRSPIDGYVTERLVEVGDKVNNNQQVYSIEDFSPLLIKVYVPSSDTVHLETGMEASISTDIIKGIPFSGKVKLINPRIDVQSGTVKVTIEVFDQMKKLKPGMFVDVNIIISNKPDALTIPRKGVIHKHDKTYVFLLQDSRVLQKEIEIGISEGDHIEVLNGLEEGMKVVSTGIETLKDQMTVRVAQ